MLSNIIRHAAAVCVAFILGFFGMSAFDLSTYADHSVLSQGNWTKIRVETTGLYRLSKSTLAQMGLSAENVHIYGYGGNRIDDRLTMSNYIDDLPEVQVEVVDGEVIFYAVGADWWTNTGNYYHKENNPYSIAGYYFVTSADGDRPSPRVVDASQLVDGYDVAESYVWGRVQLENETEQATEAGPLFVGEDFRYVPQRSYDVSTPGRIAGTNVLMECQMVAYTLGGAATMTFTLDGTTLEAISSDRIPTTSDSHYVHASIGTTRRAINPSDAEKFTLGLKFTSAGVVSKANLDYFAFNYQRSLTMPSEGYLCFWAELPNIQMVGGGEDVRLWDVTNPLDITVLTGKSASNAIQWHATTGTMRTFAAWKPGAQLPEPIIEGRVANQDLHSAQAEVDMVIITPALLADQARRLASLHQSLDSLAVDVVLADEVYNEFGSGVADVSALRKYLKMRYDRSQTTAHHLQYALLLGRTTLDQRELMASTRAMNYTTMPAWVVRNAKQSLTDNDGYTTDDFIAILGDNSGGDLGLDDLSIAVGRIPMTSEVDGASIVDKIYQYAYSSKRDLWKNRMMVVADDEDVGVHLQQAETMINNLLATENQQHIITKVYLDAYIKSSGEYPAARSDMFQTLDQGVVWWYFTGHANNHSWTGDGQFTYTDLNNLYLRHVPFVVASTCDFLRWDSQTTSGGEIMFNERYGGCIGMLSATRPVFISDNGYFLASLGRHTLERDEQGRLLTPGEVYRRSKNDIRNASGSHISNPNRLRFVFMGDPALRLASPDNTVKVLTINGVEPTEENQVTISALQNVEITGCVLRPDGSEYSDFNGTLTAELFDALKSVVTNGNGNGREDIFDTQGSKLFAGGATVTNGRFTLKVAMPSEIADNFRPATLSLYAAADNSNAEAIGVNRDFYVSGFVEPEQPDTIAPDITTMVLNHSDFQSGDVVNSDPMLIATVTDDVGINISTAGIGRQMTITLDGNNTLTDVATYYTPYSDGTPGGIINYPLENLADGNHTILLRVFDTSGNCAYRDIECFVDQSLTPQIFDVYTDSNPASVQANFYIRHDRPDGITSVFIEVFDLMGRPVWSGSSTGMSDGDLSAPVTWDLCDFAGRRVQRGIYLYRASITTDLSADAKLVTACRRLAVTAQ